MNKSFFLSTYLSLAFLLSCSSNDEIVENNIPYEPIKIEAHEIEIAQNEVGFGIDLFKALMADNDDYNNTAIGPYSVSTVLTMLANSKDEDVQKEICAALGNNSDVASLTKYHSKLHERLPKMDNRVDLKLSNSMWVTDKYEFLPEFSSTLASSLGAESYKVNFATQEGINKINNWCKNATNGLIPVILEKPIQTDVMLISSTFFDGKWTNPFKESDTYKGLFKTEASGFKQINMMSIEGKFQYYVNEKMSIARLPYGNGSYNMNLILPGERKSKDFPLLKDFIANFSSKDWIEFRDQFKAMLFTIQVPSFKIQNKKNLIKYLTQIGIETTFSHPVNGLINAAEGVNINQFINSIDIDVKEEGTKVADISYISGDTDGSVDMIFNHPFIFIIDEVSTGTILYIGAVQNF